MERTRGYLRDLSLDCVSQLNEVMVDKLGDLTQLASVCLAAAEHSVLLGFLVVAEHDCVRASKGNVEDLEVMFREEVLLRELTEED